MINGKHYSWEDITITLPYGVMIGVQSIDYGDKKDDAAEYGKGSTPIGYSGGNYDADCSFTLLKSEAQKLNDAFRIYPAFYRHKSFPILVSYANPDSRLMFDLLPSVRITERKASNKQGDHNIGEEFTCIVLEPIVWDAQKAVDY